MISYGNPNIFFANIGRGDVGIAPYNSSLKWNLKRIYKTPGGFLSPKPPGYFYD